VQILHRKKDEMGKSRREKPDHCLMISLTSPDGSYHCKRTVPTDDDVVRGLEFLARIGDLRSYRPAHTRIVCGGWVLGIKSRCLDFPSACETPCSANWQTRQAVYAACPKEALLKAAKWHRWLGRLPWERFVNEWEKIHVGSAESAQKKDKE
jgi:hypothetical protein